MSHDLEMVNGKGVMFSAQGLTPWHHLGVIVDKVACAADAIALLGPSTVKVEPVFTRDGTPIDGQFCTRRQEDGAVFGMVSDRYHVLNDSEAFDLADVLVQSGEAEYATAGRMRGGARTWLQLRLNGGRSTVGGMDAIDRYMLISNSHDGKQAVKIGWVDCRVVCKNTMAQAVNSESAKLLRVRHSSKMIPALEDIRLSMDTARSEFQATIETYNHMANKGINKADLEKYVCKVFDASPDDPPRCLAPIVKAFESAPGADMAGSTAWGAYNAVSWWLTHEQGRTDEGRLDNNMFGTSVAVNQNALQYAYNYATVGSF